MAHGWSTSGTAPPSVNHSCQPSARMGDPRTIVAARAMGARKEVTIDCATTGEDPGWELGCRCGGRACRGLVRGESRLER